MPKTDSGDMPPFSARRVFTAHPYGLKSENAPSAEAEGTFRKIGARGASGGDGRTRTGDILLAKQALYQLSYAPEARDWWA